MKNDNELSPLNNSEVSILNNVTEAHKLIAADMEEEAKNKFPLEFYLLRKYMDGKLDDFTSQLRTRIRLEH